MNKKSSVIFFIVFALVIFTPLISTLPMLLEGNYVIPIIVAVICIYLIGTVIGKYNKMIKYKNKIDEALGLVDIQLKMRFDLIPNLVNIVKGYAKHEKEVFTSTIKLRNKAAKAQDESEKLELANQLVPKIKDILMVAEDYPKLKSEALFKSLLEQLSDIEDRIVSARRIYDSNVNMFNTLISTFPNNLLAKIFGHSKVQLFKIDAGENINTKINF